MYPYCSSIFAISKDLSFAKALTKSVLLSEHLVIKHHDLVHATTVKGVQPFFTLCNDRQDFCFYFHQGRSEHDWGKN